MYFLRNLESGVLPGGIAELDEYGPPTPLACRLLDGIGSEGDSVVDRLGQPRVAYLDQQNNLELVERWIVADVLEGYVGRGWRAAE